MKIIIVFVLAVLILTSCAKTDITRKINDKDNRTFVIYHYEPGEFL